MAVAQLAIGAMLLGAAVVVWKGSTVAEEMAAVHEQNATFRAPSIDAGQVPAWLSPIVAVVDPDVRLHDATASYWKADYGALTERARAGDDEPEVLLLAANAAFRRAQADVGRTLSPERLDQILQGYAAVLKNKGFDRDAAYNYEYVARLRDQAARAKPSTAKPDATARNRPVRTPRPSSGLPDGPTVHGRPGTHPPPTRGEEFEVITPMDFGDRESQPEPTPGVRLPKKG